MKRNNNLGFFVFTALVSCCVGMATAQSDVPGDDCASATYEIGALPWGPYSDTTTGLSDTYDLGGSGTCAGGGTQYGTTGDGPDAAFLLRVDQDCDITVSADPTTSWDLALYVVTDCGSLASSCMGVDDSGGSGTQEDVTFFATAGTDYYVIVDGYNGGNGPFDFSVATIGNCSLVPVELIDIRVE